MDSTSRTAFLMMLIIVLCGAFFAGCTGAPKPDLVLSGSAELLAPVASPTITEGGGQKATYPIDDAPSNVENVMEGWFFLSPDAQNTAQSGEFSTNLPDGCALYAELRIAPLGGEVALTKVFTVEDGLLAYDFSDRVPTSAIEAQYATLTLSLRFSDPQPKKLTSEFGEFGEGLVDGFVAGKMLAARVKAKFALPFPNANSVGDLVSPSFSNPTDPVYATTRRYHRESCRYSEGATPTARAYAIFLDLEPCAICEP